MGRALTMSCDQYLRLTRPVPAAVLFFRVGDCYEMDDEDAWIVARKRGWPAATREFGGGERVLLCLLPYHTTELSIRHLVARVQGKGSGVRADRRPT
jgi:DNA mismatch repair protein MutS